MKSVNIKTRYIDYPCTIEFAQYRNGQIAIRLFDANTGELAATATASLEGVSDIDWRDSQWKGITAIKDYSENEGVFDSLVNAGVIEPIGSAVETEFVSFPLARVLLV